MLKIAIVGATGLVGQELVSVMADRDLPPLSLRLFASASSAGKKMFFRDRSVEVEEFRSSEVAACDFVLMSAGSKFSRDHAREITKTGAVLVDNSSAWRLDEDVPLVVPEVNADCLIDRSKVRIVANPNCSTIQLVPSLAALHREAGLEVVNVVTMQSVSGSGRLGLAELKSQTEALANFQEPRLQIYEQPVCQNIIPFIGEIEQDHNCEEEIKIVNESRKILGIESLPILATTTRVPVPRCHCEAVTVKLSRDVSYAEARSILSTAAGIDFSSTLRGAMLPSPFHVEGQDDIKVARLRLLSGQDRSQWLQFWIVADNIRKGAAVNAVQILEKLVN